MIDIDNLESIKNMIISPAWKLLEKEMRANQEELKELLVEYNISTDEGRENVRSTQAMYHAIDNLYETVTDLIREVE